MPDTTRIGSISLPPSSRSAGAAKWPATAVAAATAGDTRWVRPPRPWRPSKLRLDVDADRSPGASLSGFMARHIEQPGLRHSKPAAAKTRSSPSASAWALTWPDPGTTRARTDAATRRPSSTSAAARRSSIRPLVHDPMKTVSTGMSRTAVPAVEPHVGQGPLGRLPGRGLAEVVGRRDRAADRDDLGRVGAPGDVRGQGSPRRCSTSRSNAASGVGGQRPPVVERRLPRRALRGCTGGPRDRRRWCRRGRPCRPGRRPRSTCCRPSCGLPCVSARMAAPAVLDDVAHAAAGADRAR